MNHNRINTSLIKAIKLLVLTPLIIASATLTALAGQKLTPEEIVAKHLDAVESDSAK